MPQRLALAAASVVATIVLTVGLVAAGFGPLADADRPASAADDLAAADLAAEAEADLKPEVVYIKPAPSPKTIVLKKRGEAVRAASTSKSRTQAKSRTRRRPVSARIARTASIAARSRRSGARRLPSERRSGARNGTTREDDDD